MNTWHLIELPILEVYLYGAAVWAVKLPIQREGAVRKHTEIRKAGICENTRRLTIIPEHPKLKLLGRSK
jgi:hypothetical protein